MTLITLLISLLCAWSLLNFWILPLSASRWQAVDMQGKMLKAGSVAVLEKLRDLSAVATITLAAVLVLVQLASIGANTSSAVPKFIIEAAASLYAFVKTWANTYGSSVSILALLGAVIALRTVAKHAKNRVAQAWIEASNAMHAKLQEDTSEITQCLGNAELRPLAEHVLGLMSQLRAGEQFLFVDPLTQEQRQSLGEELANALSVLALEKARRELDFGSAIAKPAPDELNQKPSFWGRIGRVVSSKRLSQDLGFFKKPVSYLLTSLVVISLVTWSAEPMANSLRLAINNLRVNLDASEVKRSLDTAISIAQQDQSAPSEDDAGDAEFATTMLPPSRLIANAAVQQLLHSPVISQIAKKDQTQLSNAEYVRAAITGQQISTENGSDPIASLRSEIANDVANEPAKVSNQTDLERHVEKQIQPLVEQLSKDSHGHMRRVLTTLESRYSSPFAPLDAQGKLLENILDAALGSVDANPTSELGKQGQTLLGDFGKKALNTWIDSYARSYVAELVLEAARPEVARAVRPTPSFETSEQGRKFLNNLFDAQGKDWSPTGVASEQKRLSVAVANVVTQHYSDSPGMDLSLRESLSSYDGFFPSDFSGEGGEGGGGGGGGGGANQKTNSGGASGRSFSQSRATNFHLASRSFRVRGVLIGQQHTSEGLAINDIRWSLQPSRNGGSTRIELEIRIDKTWQSIGHFDAGVVNQALRYGADRRVVAATITPGDGKIIDRITHLHPALLDTPLGCRVVEADRFIDTLSFTQDRDFGKPDFLQLSQDRMQMQRWVSALKLADSVADVSRNGTCPKNKVEQIIEENKLGGMVFSKNLTGVINHFIDDEEKKKPGSTQFLRKAHQCVKEPSNQVSQCFCDLAHEPAAKMSPYWMPVDHTSQVRERPTTLVPDLAWLKRSPDNFGHFDFWVHTTLALYERPSAYAQKRADEASATAINFPDAQLAALRDHLRSKISLHLKKQLNTASVAEFMSPLEDFVLLQRLFRAGLDGRVGPAFPIAKLITMERETRKFVPFQPTIRWEGQAGWALEKVLQEADPKALDAYSRWKVDRGLRMKEGRPMCGPASK